jgi:hypothetical protein
MKVVKEYELEMSRQAFSNDCHLDVWVRQGLADEVTRKLTQAEVRVEAWKPEE